ncbi:FG-GAP repeat domain-containing protein [Nannocystis bainbridge]|uniref:VCBS repeat-containing protein n=1 Tax=Nannocystis bainbridge TaxID=2995303 RepID=A0ABT5DWW2_9BACT|nr:VCBS repeat-containing protein [Nannocystis bainbridge]MDC0718084.1 VCBS repeat-containing protein [Nannocystis bainbridge]
MIRLLPAALLVGSAACIFPLSPDPTGSDPDTDASGSTTGAVDPVTGEPDPTGGPGTTAAPTTSGATTSDGSGEPSTGGPDITGDDPSPAPIVTEVWEFDAMDLGDVDGDGRLDLVTSGTGAPPRITVYPGRGDGSFDRDAAVDSPLFGFSQFVVADVTGDGRADVLAHGTGSPPRITVYAGGDDLTVSELATTQLFTFKHMHAGDLTGDGHADLLIGDGDSFMPWVQVWPGTESGIADAPLSAVNPWAYALLRSGDVTGDGHLDLVTASTGSPPQLYVHPGDGAGNLGEPQIAEIFNLSWFDLGDFDGDGLADAATDIPGNAWRFQVYLATQGGWTDPVAHDGFNFVRFELGDLDGDGRADLVAQAAGYPPRVEVYLGAALP